MVLRIFASIILAISILFMPFWLSVILVLAGMVYFAYFLEAIALFFLSDLLYGVKEVKFFEITFVSFILAVLFLIAIELIKKKLRFYN